MYVLYEDSNKFKAEKVFSRAERSLQVESATGKRSKIRTDRVFLEFSQPDPEQLLAQAEQLAATIDINFVWECAPQEVFDAAEFAADYFGTAQPTAIQQAALIFALHAAPAYFHRRGAGKYRPAPPETLQAALAAIERRRQEEERQQALTEAMLRGELPEDIAAQAETLLTQPDKNSTEWKAFQAVLQAKKCSPEALLLELNAWSSPLALHRHRFFTEYFPRGTAFERTPEPCSLDLQHYPLAEVEAYSIDDGGTTEIDDAFSVRPLDDHRWRIGIHIAVPALGIERHTYWDEQARQRMATVYMPGQKIPMLPEALVEQFSLLEQHLRPALSLYVDFDSIRGEIVAEETRLERICVTKNLFHDELNAHIHSTALEDPEQPLPYGDCLRPLWTVAKILRKQREEARGWPEHNDRPEFLFQLEGPADDPNSIVHLIPRNRQSPLGIITAELMILANKLWAGLLQQRGLTAAFRSQQNMRTRMSTHALPHKSIGVPYYLWATSPLRRYIDLVNQRQIIAAAQHGVSARLVAPYQAKDPDLFALITAFEEQYSAWNEFQHKIERYWALRWIQQQQKTRLHAHVIRNDLVRCTEVPLVTPVPGLPELERGQEVWIEVVDINEVDLSMGCRLIEVRPLDEPCTE